jgi:uncharacterized protein (DUF1501 family)
MISRRRFLRDTSLTLAAFGAAPSIRGAEAAPPTRVIVFFQRGAADGLSMVVPYTDAAYYDSRPTIAVPPPGSRDGGIDLDGRVAFHPRLAPLMPLYRAGRLAVVRNCGLGVATESHLEAQAAADAIVARIGGLARAGGGDVMVVNSGQWDDHADQGGASGRFAARLDALATRLCSTATNVGDDPGTVIVTLTEFGRSLRENARGGTGHGRGSVMLVIGTAVAGGRVHTRADIRDVFSEFTPWHC